MASKECAVKCAFANQCRALKAVNGRRELAEDYRASMWRTADGYAEMQRNDERVERERQDAMDGYLDRTARHLADLAESGEISSEEAARRMRSNEAGAAAFRKRFDDAIEGMTERLSGKAAELGFEDVAAEGSRYRGISRITASIARATEVIEEMEGLQAIAVEGCEQPSMLRKIGNLLSYGRGPVPTADRNPYLCHNPAMVEAMRAYDTGDISGMFDGLPMPFSTPDIGR